MENKQSSFLNANTLELHYWLNDGTHSMDAFVQNKCEYEFLGILKEIAASFNAEIIIETEPLADGGLRRWFKIISKSENKNAPITTAIIILAAQLIITPLAHVGEKFIDKLFEDKELVELDKEKTRAEIENLKLDIEAKKQALVANNVIKKRKSNFYDTLENYPKVNHVSISIENEHKELIVKEDIVDRVDFKKFVLVSDDLEPIEVEDAIIEIISPVLKKGKYQWMGVYNGEAIPFNMKSNEYKTLVQTGDIEFKNGSSINCHLRIRKRINNEGIEKIIGYDVVRVNHYFENEKPIETPEGKRYRQKQEAEKNQMKFDF